jgi:hypothetical protein
MLRRRLWRPIEIIAVTHKPDGTPTELLPELAALGNDTQERLWAAVSRMSSEQLSHELREIPGSQPDREGIWMDLELRIRFRLIRLIGQVDFPGVGSPPGARVVFKVVQVVDRPYLAVLRRRYLGK